MRLLDTAWGVARKLIATVVAVGALGYAIYGTATSEKIAQAERLEAKLVKTMTEVDRLRRSNRRLQLLILNMAESPALAEKVAREDGGMIKEGEILYIFPH